MKKLIVIVGIIGMILFSIFTKTAVFIDDVYLGSISENMDSEDLKAIIDEKLRSIYASEVKMKSKITIEKRLGFDKSIDEGELLEKITKMDSLIIDGSILKLGQSEYRFISRNQIDELFEDIKKQYMKSEAEYMSVYLDGDYSIISKDVSLGSLSDKDQILSKLLEFKTVHNVYKVKSGDTIYDISIKQGISQKKIAELNPEIDIEKIGVGDEIVLEVEESPLNVITVEKISKEEKIPFQTKVEYSDKLFADESKVKVEGSYGSKIVTYEVKKSNGLIIDNKLLQENTVLESSDRIVIKGEKYRNAVGILSRPTQGLLTSRFGQRWGRSHKGIDLASEVGTPIKAAGSGKVTYSAWMNGYGYLVIIDHGGGMESYYAHNSSIDVKKGDRVRTGDIIAYVGTTGNVTGPNLHFEVRINKIPVNPEPYIKSVAN